MTRIEIATRPFPGVAFHDEDIFAFERARILARAWLCVGRTDEVALPGQWIREEIAGEPILVVRGADLRLRAFFDVCRHRGVSIVGRAPCGRLAHFECPYHGWRYELDGRGSTSSEDLLPVRVDEWRGFLFVTLSKDTSPLAEWLGTTPPWLSQDRLASLELGRRTTYVVNANFKLLVENFQESHHFPRVHAALERLTPTSEARSWLTPGPWLGGTMEIENAETVSLDGSAHGRPLISPEPRVFDALLFPALFTSLQPDYLLTYRLHPIRAGRTRIVADIYFHPAAFKPDFDPRDVYEFWDRVNAEDQRICEDQQSNVTSRAFAPAKYLPVEEGVDAFDEMIARAHLAEHTP
jgi:Rieske 2Fe-2S family protein